MLALESYQELVKVKNKRSWKDFEAYLILCFVSRVNYEKLGAWRQSPDLEIQFCLLLFVEPQGVVYLFRDPHSFSENEVVALNGLLCTLLVLIV